MQREKMEYKQFQRHHNAMQSGRGREMEGRLKKKCRENGQMKREGQRIKKQTFRDTQCERWLLD